MKQLEIGIGAEAPAMSGDPADPEVKQPGDTAHGGTDGHLVGNELQNPPVDEAAESTYVLELGLTKANGRIFFPCNREDALILLGSLCISDCFPEFNVTLAVQPEGIAIIEGGLRISEEELLHGGMPERFPVLVELSPDVPNGKPRVIEYGHVVGLRFRNAREAEDFRFRPVDEFDTEEFECSVEPELFHQYGDSRFSIRSTLDQHGIDIGRFADRLAAGVGNLVALGEHYPICRKAVICLLCHEGEGDQRIADFDIALVIEMLAGNGGGRTDQRQAKVITSVFAKTDQPTASSLIENIARDFELSEAGDEKTQRMEGKWVEVAKDITRNRMVLDGEHLGDFGSIILRAALLAAMVDDVEALGPFLHAEKPSGPMVTSIAAFLVGLKHGLISSSWIFKRTNKNALSSLAALLRRNLVLQPDSIGSLFSTQTNERGGVEKIAILAGGVPLAEWESRNPVPPDAVTQRWLAEFNRLGYEVLGIGASSYSWTVRLSDKYDIEVTRGLSGEMEFPMLNYRVGGGGKLKKPRDLRELSRKQGTFWHVITDDSGEISLLCDLLVLPDDMGRRLILNKLDETLANCLVTKKTRGKRTRSKTPPLAGDLSVLD